MYPIDYELILKAKKSLENICVEFMPLHESLGLRRFFKSDLKSGSKA